MFFTKREVSVNTLKKQEILSSFISHYSLINNNEINPLFLKDMKGTNTSSIPSTSEIEEKILAEEKELEQLENNGDVREMLEEIEKEEASVVEAEEAQKETAETSEQEIKKEEPKVEESTEKEPDKESEKETKKDENTSENNTNETGVEVETKQEVEKPQDNEDKESQRMLSELLGEEVDLDSNDEYERLLSNEKN